MINREKMRTPKKCPYSGDISVIRFDGCGLKGFHNNNFKRLSNKQRRAATKRVLTNVNFV